MRRFSVELVVDGRAALGECPVWDDRRERLLWIDMPRGEVHSVDVSSGDDDVVAVGQPVGSISCRRTDGLVIALRDGFGLLETADDHTLVRTSRRVPNTSRQQLYALGIAPERFQVVVAKGVDAPLAAYEPIAAQVILVDTPGATSADLSRFTYRRRRRPLHPFEPDAAYPD